MSTPNSLGEFIALQLEQQAGHKLTTRLAEQMQESQDVGDLITEDEAAQIMAAIEHDNQHDTTNERTHP
jgi:parvulin-like peptidyl-prolyl isomerase